MPSVTVWHEMGIEGFLSTAELERSVKLPNCTQATRGGSWLCARRPLRLKAFAMLSTAHACTLPQVVCGVQAPSMGRKAAPAPAAAAATDESAAAAAAANGGAAAAAPSVPSAASIAGASAAEPFALEAKYLTEMKVLAR
jgi:hypothetical protein